MSYNIIKTLKLAPFFNIGDQKHNKLEWWGACLMMDYGALCYLPA